MEGVSRREAASLPLGSRTDIRSTFQFDWGRPSLLTMKTPANPVPISFRGITGSHGVVMNAPSVKLAMVNSIPLVIRVAGNGSRCQRSIWGRAGLGSLKCATVCQREVLHSQISNSTDFVRRGKLLTTQVMI